jgi:hypothetical protein
MLADWKAFLSSEGARIENGQVLDFGAPDAEASIAAMGNMLTDLSYVSVVKITGADAAAFLNGQFTSDLAHVPEAGVQFSAWCNPKGQVIANFILVRLGGVYFLLLPREMKEAFINRLRRYVLRAQVTLEDCSDSMQCVGYKHKEGDQLPGHEIEHRLSIRERAIQQNGLVMLHVPMNWNRMIMFGSPAVLAAAWSNLAHAYGKTGSHSWRLLDILDGLPWITTATSETCLPQSLNLDLLGGLSFQKGCFPGQEVIARLHYRGLYKQRLYIAKLEKAMPVSPGTKVLTHSKPHTIGTVMNAAAHPTQGLHALMVLDVDHSDPDKLYLENSPARIKQLLNPPYVTAE